MRIKKIYNNNIILAHDEKFVEKVLLGKGVAFGKKEGEEVDKEKIEKVFTLESKELVDRFVNLVGEIPINHLELTNAIVKEAEKELSIKFNDSIYIGLTDHINYALYRYRQGEQMRNAFLWEVKKFYPKEYKVALKALEIIYYFEKVKLNVDEASFIALHFVNGQNLQSNLNIKGNNENAVILDILNIIKFHYNIEIEEDSINYSRFVTHLRYFLQRINGQVRYSSDDNQLFLQVKTKYKKAYECILKINAYFNAKMSVTMTTEEQLYFVLHINRLTTRENQIRSSNGL
ncbi:BglG family transcription antiterminator LicT [Bacillus sp. Au-Bac7]|uniref:BglG family transcription antiterminator LicT n=1 Tax=Bacillus sp. Au-Bac7 TaxID=2906458 RepID=UPI001E541DC2|nr:PRD domain-containing protein [Bacillus sp. Au-Bac7]MCE4052185.1 PRD domain-containing protein [Bacillus sp. Au-Bac7]